MAAVINTKLTSGHVPSARRQIPCCPAQSATPYFRVALPGQLRNSINTQAPFRRHVAASAAPEDAPVPAPAADLIVKAGALRSLSFISFWAQLALSLTSALVFAFSMAFTASNATMDMTRYLTLVGIVFSFISTFFAHGFNTLAKKVDRGEEVHRSWVVGNLLNNSTLNFLGIGSTLIGLQAAVGTLVAKTLLTSATNPYNPAVAQNAVISLDVFSLQASTNTILAHFVSLLLINIMLRFVNKPAPAPAAA